MGRAPGEQPAAQMPKQVILREEVNLREKVIPWEQLSCLPSLLSLQKRTKPAQHTPSLLSHQYATQRSQPDTKPSQPIEPPSHLVFQATQPRNRIYKTFGIYLS